jgi:predicted dehydrogenase
MLEEGELGALRRITYTMGEPFEWPAATGSYFGARGSCKGVLLDTGAHIIDLVCWWLGHMPRLIGYRDDSFGGTEAVAQIDMESKQCQASVRLSWLSKLDNRFRIEGERGRIEGAAYDWGRIEHTNASGRVRRVKTGAGHQTFDDFAAQLIDNFVDVLRGRARPLVEGREVLASVTMIDACYRSRQRFEMPWQDAWQALRNPGDAAR